MGQQTPTVLPLTAAPQSCSYKSHEPAPLGASEQRSYPPTGSQVAALITSVLSCISLNEDSAELPPARVPGVLRQPML